MKAAVVTGRGKPPVYADFPTPSAGPGEELITVSASAVSNFTKGRASGSHYSAANAYPAVAGIDGVGTTAGGRRVYFVLPEAPNGALAEFCPMDASRTIPVPESLDDLTAAAIANPGMSAWASLVERAHLVAGETVLINGATGAAGRIAVQLAKHLGAARVIATGRNVQELEAVKLLGADLTLALPASGDPAAAKAFEGALVDAFATGIGVVVDYLCGESAKAIIVAIAKGVEDVTPVRFVNVGSVSGGEIALPAAALRSSSIVMMGSGVKSVALPVLLRAVGSAFAAVVAAGLQVATKTAPLRDIERAWAEDTGKPRLVVTV